MLIIVAIMMIQLPFLAKGLSIASLSGPLVEALRQAQAGARRRRRLWAAQRRAKARSSSGASMPWAGGRRIPVAAVDRAFYQSWIDEVSQND
jgi:hypothetical protein